MMPVEVCSPTYQLQDAACKSDDGASRGAARGGNIELCWLSVQHTRSTQEDEDSVREWRWAELWHGSRNDDCFFARVSA